MPLDLICLPYAGAGASIYRAWRSHAPTALRIIAPQLPGREQRIREALPRSVAECIDDVWYRVSKELSGTRPAVIFGHSLGAVLAFELAHRLHAAGICLERLLVSGSPGPASPRVAKAAALDDAAFLKRVADLAGYRHPALDDPSLRGMLLPILRADVAMHESYVADPLLPLDVPVTAIRGDEDTLVSDEDLESWRDATRVAFEAVRMRGGHMYFAQDPRPLLDLILGMRSP